MNDDRRRITVTDGIPLYDAEVDTRGNVYMLAAYDQANDRVARYTSVPRSQIANALRYLKPKSRNQLKAARRKARGK